MPSNYSGAISFFISFSLTLTFRNEVNSWRIHELGRSLIHLFSFLYQMKPILNSLWLLGSLHLEFNLGTEGGFCCEAAQIIVLRNGLKSQNTIVCNIIDFFCFFKLSWSNQILCILWASTMSVDFRTYGDKYMLWTLKQIFR